MGNPVAIGDGGQIRNQEGKTADQQTLLELVLEKLRVNLGSCQEGEQDAAETGQKVHPRSRVQAQEVSCNYPRCDLNDSCRESDFYRHDTGEKNQERYHNGSIGCVHESSPEKNSYRQSVGVISLPVREQFGELHHLSDLQDYLPSIIIVQSLGK